MDIATVIGIISGIGLILGSILLNSSLLLFFNVPSIMIVAGGTIASVLIAYPLNEFFKVFKIIGKVFFYQLMDPQEVIDQMVELSKVAKREGILAIDRRLKDIKDDFLRKGLQLVVDGVEDANIDRILTLEVTNQQKRHRVGWEIFSEMGKYAPSFGMIGTLIGLIQMLASLDDPKTIGPKMAVALITTFYGSVLANLVFVPMSVKLKRRSQQETLLMQLIIEAIKSIRMGENPKLMEDKLTNFLSDRSKRKSSKDVGKEGKSAADEKK